MDRDWLSEARTCICYVYSATITPTAFIVSLLAHVTKADWSVFERYAFRVLKHLGLVFDATDVGPTQAGRSGGVCNTNIIKFCAGCSPIEQPPQVACALLQILSYLRTIEVEPLDANQESQRTKWSKVLDCIGAYAVIKQPT